METQKSNFQRNLLLVLGSLFGLSLFILSYFTWTVEGNNLMIWEMLLNVLILSIPLVLIFGSIYVLLMGWHEQHILGKIGPRLARIIHWTPRIAALLIILFTGLFSLDVFGEGGSPLEVLGAFLMHNIPAIAMILVLVFAWKRPVVGFVAFLVVAAAFIIFFVRDVYALTNLVIFVLPMLLIALLFYADWQWVKA